MICDSILDALGHTPLVRLRRMVTPDMAEVLVKFEALNVGSVGDGYAEQNSAGLAEWCAK